MRAITKNASFALDAIRGMSAQLVLVGHALSIYGIYGSHKELPVIQNLGVVIFFALSGFLIINSILNKPVTYRFLEYFFDRFSRIYIAYIPAIVFVWICDAIFSNSLPIKEFENQRTVYNFLGNLFMLQNHPLNLVFHSGFQPFGSGRPFWTVAVEWWIYMFVGFVLIYLRKNNLFNIKNLIIFAFLSMVPLFNIIGRGNGLMITWIFGSFIALVPSEIKSDSFKIKAWIYYLILFVCFLGWGLRTYGTNSINQYDLGISFLVVCGIFAILQLADISNWQQSISKPIQDFFITTANYSYSLYLIHYTIVVILFQKLSSEYSPLLRITVTILIANVGAFIFYRCTEYYTIKFKKLLKKKFL